MFPNLTKQLQIRVYVKHLSQKNRPLKYCSGKLYLKGLRNKSDADGRTRTGTDYLRLILSQVRLPIPPHRRMSNPLCRVSVKIKQVIENIEMYHAVVTDDLTHQLCHVIILRRNCQSFFIRLCP